MPIFFPVVLIGIAFYVLSDTWRFLFRSSKVVETSVPKIYAKRTTEIISEQTEIEVGKVTLQLTFKDGKKFKYVVYGRYDLGPTGLVWGFDASATKPMVQEPRVYDSIQPALKIAQWFLSDSSTTQHRNYLNDSKNPTENYIGELISAKIVKVEKHKESVLKYFLRDIQEKK